MSPVGIIERISGAVNVTQTVFACLPFLGSQGPTGREVKITSSTEKKPSKCVLL